VELNGYVAPGFGQVAEEFSRNFTVRDDLGASFAVMRDDEPLVDLWGGIADRASARAWTADTLQILFSGTKGLVAASQPRSADPRATRTYHAVTFGWLCGELVRRIDGRGIGQFFAEEIAGPLDLELWIGLPAEARARISTVELAPTWASVSGERLALDPLRRAIGNPPRYQPDSFPWNEAAWHAAEVPSSNGIGTARSVARFYARLDQLLSPASVRLGSTVLSSRYDPLMERQTSFGVGFQLQTDMLTLGPVPDAFGHGGAGGSVHGCWPRQRLGFSYAMNLLRDDPGDTRAAALLTALYHCVEQEAAA
jgi:CubicO group peptidase (beta-lactamase class C family)